jgi:hypothetical protein
MKRVRVVALCSLGLLFALASSAWAGSTMKLGSFTGYKGDTFSIPLTLANPDGDVQGLVFSAEWDAAGVICTGIVNGTAIATADTVVPRFTDGFAVLGIVMQTTMGTTPKVIPAGAAEKPIATLNMSGVAVGTFPLKFVDGKYNTTQGGPPLDNIIVIGANSIGQTDKDGQGNAKLILTNGSVTLTNPPVAPPKFTVESATGSYGHRASVNVKMKSVDPVQGYVMGLRQDAGITLASIAPSAAVTALAPDFVQADIIKDVSNNTIAGQLGVVMVLQGGAAKTIPAGEGDIATLGFDSPALTSADCPNGRAAATYNLKFADDLGDPVKPNVVVVNGQSLVPTKVDGTLTLSSLQADINLVCQVAPEAQLELAAGSCTNMVQDPRFPPEVDPLIPGPITAHPGDAFGLGVYYRFPESVVLDATMPADIGHQIQGMSIAMKYDATYITCLGTHSEKGSIYEAVGGEYFTMHFKETAGVGELIIGILMDAAPPFEGQYLPPTDDFLKLTCIDFQLLQGACEPGKTQSTKVEFVDGLYGKGTVPVNNLASVGNYSWPMKGVSNVVFSGQIIVVAEAKFVRGDCNFSSIDHIASTGKSAVDIADPAAVISYLFQAEYYKFTPKCLDACDANDDGRVDLADALAILRYLFKFGAALPEPFNSSPGVDPTADHLDCAGSTTVCN